MATENILEAMYMNTLVSIHYILATHLDHTLMSTEECGYEDLRAFLDTLTPIDDFIPITDDSYLTN